MMQVAILLSRMAHYAPISATQSSLLALSQPEFDLHKIAKLYKGFTSLQQRVDTMARALAANGINVH